MNTSLIYFENPIWNPTALPNSMIFVSADNINNFNNINNITTWYDLSNNNNHLYLDKGVTEYNFNDKSIIFGKNNSATRFNTGKTLLTTTYNNSFFVAVKITNPTLNAHIIGQSTLTTVDSYVIGLDGNGRYRFVSRNPTYSYTDNNIYFNNYQLININIDNYFKYIINGVNYYSTSINSGGLSSLSFTVGHYTANDTSIKYLNGQIEFVLVTDGIVDNVAKEKIEGWWAHTFNHLDLLQNNHPYKINYPI